MTGVLCPRCGTELAVPTAAEGELVRTRCWACDLEVAIRVEPEPPAPPAPPPGDPPATRAIRLHAPAEGLSTSFHPETLVGGASAAERSPAARGVKALVDTAPVGTQGGRPPAPAPPRPAYFLRIGAPAGRERLALPSARALFGRRAADVLVDDPTVSAPHFQVEAIGREFFVRDLGSTNGTLLNGRPVRYAELRPGDLLQVGQVELVFRAEGDGIDRAGAADPLSGSGGGGA